MGSWQHRVTHAVLGFAAFVVCAPPAAAQDEKALGWFYSTELSAVFTSGNATSNTLGLGAGVRRVWENTEISLRGNGLRTRSGTTTRSAVGTPDDFQVAERTDTRLTAENYSVRSRIDRTFGERFLAYAGVGWERNTFSGFDSRVTAVAGAGNTWADNERLRFKTNYGVTYTVQNDIVQDVATADSFGGVQLRADFWRKVTTTTTFESALVVDENLAQTDDLRADWTHSLLVAVSKALALRASVQVLFDNLPSLTTVDLEQPAGMPTGTTVQVPLDEVDTRFTIALVANF